ncbi:MAG: PAS domain S-box protein [Desulfatibacillaceae bacterium]
MDSSNNTPPLVPETSDSMLLSRYLLGFAIAVALFFLGARFVDQKAVDAHEKMFNQQQSRQVLIAKRALEDHVSRIISDAGSLATHSLFEYAKGGRTTESISDLLKVELAAHPDLLVYAYYTGPRLRVAMESVRLPGADRARDMAEKWAAEYWPNLADSRRTVLVPPIHANPVDQLAGLLYPVRVDDRVAGLLVVVTDLWPMIQRYVVQLAFGSSGRSFILDGRGTVIYDHDRGRIGMNVFAETGDEDSGMLPVYRRMIEEQHGTDEWQLMENGSGGPHRRLVAWGTLYWGDRRIVMGQSAADMEIDDILSNLRLQRNLLFGYLVIVSLVGGYIFYRSRKRLYGKTTAALRQIVQERTAELQDSQARYKDILNSIEEGYFEVDIAGNLTFANRSILKTLGYSLEEGLGRNNREYSTEKTARDAFRVFSKIHATKQPGRIGDYEIIDRDGEVRILDVVASPIVEENGEVTGFRGVTRDVTDQRRTEEALRESQRRLDLAIKGANLGLWDWDISSGEVVFNEVWARMLELPPDQLQGQMNQYRDRLHPEDMEGFSRVISSHLAGESAFFKHEHRLRTASGRWKWLSVQGNVVEWDESGRPARMAGIHMDINRAKESEREKKELENRLLQAQKMEAIGTLAGGIAHDFNNILSAVVAYAEAADLQIDNQAKVRGNLQEIQKASRRAKDLARQILTFSRRAEMERSPVRVDVIVKEAMKLLRATLPTTVEIRTSMPVEPVAVLSDATRLHQVLMNLCSNAGYSMRGAGGVMNVVLDTVEVWPHDKPAGTELPPGEYVRIRVTDTGKGMDPHTMERIFEPYFTTKEMGEGTGLGLAVVHGIVTEAGGACTVESEMGVGTTFRVYLPRIEMDSEEEARQLKDMPGGSERVLLVDDEPTLVESFTQVLEHFGYDVYSARDSDQALEMFSRNPDAFDLVITDQTMPGITGDELAVEMMAIRPELPVILCSGYSASISEKEALESGIRAYVMKPFVFTDFVELMRRVLDEPGQKRRKSG